MSITTSHEGRFAWRPMTPEQKIALKFLGGLLACTLIGVGADWLQASFTDVICPALERAWSILCLALSALESFARLAWGTLASGWHAAQAVSVRNFQWLFGALGVLWIVHNVQGAHGVQKGKVHVAVQKIAFAAFVWLAFVYVLNMALIWKTHVEAGTALYLAVALALGTFIPRAGMVDGGERSEEDGFAFESILALLAWFAQFVIIEFLLNNKIEHHEFAVEPTTWEACKVLAQFTGIFFATCVAAKKFGDRVFWRVKSPQPSRPAASPPAKATGHEPSTTAAEPKAVAPAPAAETALELEPFWEQRFAARRAQKRID